MSWSLESRRHRGAINATALSPDGKLLATGGLDGTVRLWDTETGKLVRALIGHDSYVYGLDFAPDGTVLATAGTFDTTVRLWDVRSGMPLRVLKQQIDMPRYLTHVSWSPDAKTVLAAGGASGTLCRWSAPTGNYQTTFEFGRPVQALAWSPDSRSAAIISTKLPVQIWDADTNKVTKKFGDETIDFRSVAYSPNGKLLAAGTSLTTIIYDAETGAEKTKFDGQGQAITWSSDGKLLAAAMSAGAEIRIYDVAEEKLLKTIPATVYTLFFAPDDKHLIGADSNSFGVFGSDEMKMLRSFEIAGTAPPFWHSGRPVITGIGTPKISLWDQTTGKLLRTLEGHGGAIISFAWSPTDGKIVATAAGDKTVRLWDTATGKSTRTFEGHTASVAAVAFSPDGKSVASGGNDKQVLVWDAGSGKTLQTFGGFQDSVTAIAWAPGSTGMFAAGSYDKKVRLLNAKSPQPGKVLEECGEVHSLTWSTNGQTLVSGHADHRAHMWQVSTGKQLHPLESAGDPPQVSSLAWSPNDTLLASGRGNHTMQLWNVKTAALLVSVPTMAPVQRVSWAPDSRTVVCSSADRTARFFEPSGGQLRGLLLAEAEQIVAVSADGHYRADAGGTELLVVAQLDKGQESLTPAAFGTKFKWKNTAAQVKLTGK